MDFIDQLRQKSPGAKKRIAYATSAVMTLVIFGVWASVLHFGNVSKPANATAAVANSTSTDVGPFSAFWSVISTGWDGLSNSMNQIKAGVSQTQDLINTLDAATSTNNTDTTNSQPITNAPSAQSSQKDVFILSGDSAGGSNNTQ